LHRESTRFDMIFTNQVAEALSVMFRGPSRQGGAIEAECMCVLAAHMHEVQMHASQRGGEPGDGDQEFGEWIDEVVELGERGCYERALERDGSCTGKLPTAR